MTYLKKIDFSQIYHSTLIENNFQHAKRFFLHTSNLKKTGASYEIEQHFFLFFPSFICIEIHTR